MADGPAPAAPAPAPRERGWKGVLLALVAFVFLPQALALQAALPVTETVLLLVPALAVCFLVGWWQGGSLWLAALWAAVAVSGLLLPDRLPGGGPYADLARAWALLGAGAFGVVSLASPRRPLFPRALASCGVALLLAVMMLLVSGNPVSRAREVFAERLTQRSAAYAAAMEQWLTAVERGGGPSSWLRQVGDQMAEQASGIARVAADAFPALLALETLAALALAWALYHRLSRTRIGPAMSPLRDFRFNDQMVWGFVAGLVLVLVPGLAGLQAVGWNLLLFFGVIYSLRGLGVVAWSLGRIMRSARAAGALAIAGFLLLGPLAYLPALGLGLIDTWIDWRGRARPIS
jgi:hypothetical protein